ncbi:MAG: type II secretion system ATPase GspE [Spirochaetia bacterium]|nr:type II secretion system ATPase GspE [Spirochaetia bacterium]
MHKPIGKILVENRVLDSEELEKALALQKKSASKVRIGQILIKKGVLSEEDLMRALASQYKMEFIEKLEVKNVDQIKKKISLKLLQKHRVVPYYLEKTSIKVALSDPLSLHPLDEVRLLWLGYKITPVLALESEILRIINNFFEEKEGSSGQMEGEEGLEFLDEIEDLRDSVDLANEAPIIKMVNVILSNAVNQRASDIHIEPQEKELLVRYRVDGMLHKVLSPPKSIQSGIISRIKIMSNLNIAETRLPQDGRIKIRFGGKDIDIRVSTLPAQFGERLVMRLLNKTEMNFDLNTIGFEKNVLDNFKKLIKNPNGIILITGPTGSGKTSTLYASLQTINKEDINIITVEDPVEYQISGIGQVQAKPKIGLTFAEGLRSILRQDPDIIMVGEIRDEETARVAVQSALTGHLVFSTLHTNDAPSAISRLLDMSIEPYLISATCRGFMAQRLVRLLCNSCKKKTHIKNTELKKLGYSYKYGKKISQSQNNIVIFEAGGCSECMNTGYKGRTGIYELLMIDDKIRDLIINNASIDKLKTAAIDAGMMTLREAALAKVVNGETCLEEALRVT